MRSEDPRLDWQQYFLKLAKYVATRSNCCRRKVGAVIVKDNHIIATGYNGTPAGTTNCLDGGYPRFSGHRLLVNSTDNGIEKEIKEMK